MAFLLKAGLLASMHSPVDAVKMMKTDIKNNAGKTDVKFVAVKDFPMGPRKVNLFIVTDTPAAFDPVLKKQPGASTTTGTCDLVKGAGGKLSIVVKKSTGQLPAEQVFKLIPVALGNDPTFVATSSLAKPAALGKAAKDSPLQTGANASKAHEMAKASHAQAVKEGIRDWQFEPTPAVVKAMAQSTLQLPEFKKFNANFQNFLTKNGMGNDGRLPVAMWNALLQGLADSGYVKSVIPHTQDQKSFILALDGPQGKNIREKLLEQAMNGLKPFVDHAATYLEKVAAKADSGQTWAFWSGRGAEDSAKASGGVSLEGSVGSFFAKYEEEWINFPKLTATETLPLWAAMSEMYAVKAAEYMSKFKFIGFVGPESTRDQSVFNKIEQPTFIEVITVRKRVAPPSIDWFVVDCHQPDGKTWEWTRKPATKFADRKSALADVVARYGN